MAWGKKKSETREPADQQRNADNKSVKETLRDDLIGVEDWKRSKVGYLTGFSAAKRSVGSIGKAMGDSRDRLGGLVSGLTASENTPTLADDDHADDASARFQRAMQLHGLTPRQLDTIQRNTARAGMLYFYLSLVNIAFTFGSFLAAPPEGIIMAVLRIGPLPLFMALTFKHFFTNWLVRTRQLGTAGLPKVYLTSGNLFPQKP